MRLRTAIASFTAIATAFALAGCGPEKPNSEPTPPHDGPVQPGATTAHAVLTVAELDAVPKASKPYKIVLIVKTKNNPFFKPMIEQFEATAKELGVDADVQAAAQESSYEQQVSLIQTEASKGVQAILVTPADSKALVPALKQAKEKGIVVVNLDNRLDPESVKSQGLALDGYVGADNEAGGKLAGEAMVSALSGKGDVAILEGIRGVDNAEARKRGFEAAVQGKLNIVDRQTANWETEQAYAKTQAILAKSASLAGIFCANDKMALGAAQALKEAGKSASVKLVGYDNIAEVKPLLQARTMAATIEQHPDLMGKYGVRLAVGVLDGKVARGAEFLVPLEAITGK